MSAYITITGNVRRVEEKETSKGTALTKLTIPVDTGWGDNKTTTWWNVTFFGKSAENAAKYLKQGQKVSIAGKASVRSYEKRDGTPGFSAEIDGYDWSFAGPKPQNDGDQATQASSRVQQRQGDPLADPSIPF